MGDQAEALPDDGSVPGMPGWRWVHTPGHTPGHVSLFRDADRCLIAGDAFVTVRQESATAVLVQEPEVHGPPAYYTPDWDQARQSVERLAALRPEIAATGHGKPLRGPSMRSGLDALARDFDRKAVPKHGRYVGRPAVADATGLVAFPADVPHPTAKLLLGLGAGLAVGLALHAATRRSR